MQNSDLICLPPDTCNVLIVMVNIHLGNLIVSLPVIERLLEYFTTPPTVIVDARYVALIEMLGAHKTVLAYPAQSPKRRGIRANIAPVAAMARLAAARYQVVIDLTRSKRAALLTLLTAAKHRIGFKKSDLSWVYTTRIPTENAVHSLERCAKILSCIGVNEVPPAVRLRPPHALVDQMAARLRGVQPHPGSPFIVMHPGAGKAKRLWPAERFAAVADAVVSRHGMDVCIIGTGGEKDLLEQIRGQMRQSTSAFILNPDLYELTALYEHAALIVSNESGPTHLAAATDLPIVTIFGPAKEAVWRPIRQENTTILRGDNCDPRCNRETCYAERRCLTALKTDRVIEAIDEMLARTCARKDQAAQTATRILA